MNRKIPALFVVAVLLVSVVLTACGGGSGNAPAAPAADGGAATANNTATNAADPASGDEGGTLTLWTWKVAMTPGFREAGEKYAAQSGWNVEVEAFSPDDTYRQKVMAAANSGDLPDLIHWWATRGTGFENVLVNMNDRANDADYRSNFASTAFNPCLVRETDVNNWANDAEKSDVVKALQEGDLYSIPLDMGGFFTIYGNNSILKEVGLENKVPADFDEFIEMAAKVGNETDHGGFIWAAGLPDVYYNWMGRAVENTFLGPEVSVDIINRRASMSDPRNILPLKKYEELATSGAFLDGIVTMDIDAGDMAFAAGQAGYLLGGTFTYGQLLAMGMNIDDVFSFVVPMMKDSAHNKPFHINGFTLTAMSIPQTTVNVDAAFGYIDFITLDPEGVSTFANGAYIVPASSNPAVAPMLSPAIQDMFNSLSDEVNVTSTVDNWPDSIGKKLEFEELYRDMQKIITGELTAEQAAANFDATAAAQAAAGQ